MIGVYNTHDKFVSTSFKLGISPDDKPGRVCHEPLVGIIVKFGSRTFDYLAKDASVSVEEVPSVMLSTPGLPVAMSSYLAAEVMFDNGKGVKGEGNYVEC